MAAYSMVFQGDMCQIKDVKTGKKLVNIYRTKNNMYPLEMSRVGCAYLAQSDMQKSVLWHERYGHLNFQSMQLLRQKSMVHGLPFMKKISLCEACIYGKQTRSPFSKRALWRAKYKLQLVHVDLCGPMQSNSLGGNRYFMLLIDDYSRMSWVYFLQSMSEAFEQFKNFQAMVERQSGCKLKVLRTDRGGEFTSNEFKQYCARSGI